MNNAAEVAVGSVHYDLDTVASSRDVCMFDVAILLKAVRECVTDMMIEAPNIPVEMVERRQRGRCLWRVWIIIVMKEGWRTESGLFRRSIGGKCLAMTNVRYAQLFNDSLLPFVCVIAFPERIHWVYIVVYFFFHGRCNPILDGAALAYIYGDSCTQGKCMTMMDAFSILLLLFDTLLPVVVLFTP